MSLRDYVYLLAYPRIIYLTSVEKGLPKEERGNQPGVGRSSIQVIVSAISQTFAAQGKPLPRDSSAWKAWCRGLLRRLGQPIDQKDPILRDDLKRAVEMARNHQNKLIGLRDTALMLLAFTCALRRSEISGVCLEHLGHDAGGWYLFIPHSKTDQARAGYKKPIYEATDIQYDPLLACRQWAEAAKIQAGLLFRSITHYGSIAEKALSGRAIADLFKTYCLRTNVSGHSARVGFVTQAALDGKDRSSMMVTTCHSSEAMIRKYTRDVDRGRQGTGTLL
jgi:integrase